MTARCRICGAAFREQDEIIGLMAAYWHEIPSRVNFSFSLPHDCDVATLAHKSCAEERD